MGDVTGIEWTDSTMNFWEGCTGGPNRLGNLVVAHRWCNNRKGNRTPTGCECLWLSVVNIRLGIAT